MAAAEHIGVCCYCGSRSLFRPVKGGRSRMVCCACGAPMLKSLPAQKPRPPKPGHPKPVTHHGKIDTRRKKRGKPFWRNALEEVWDEIEDIFD